MPPSTISIHPAWSSRMTRSTRDRSITHRLATLTSDKILDFHGSCVCVFCYTHFFFVCITYSTRDICKTNREWRISGLLFFLCNQEFPATYRERSCSARNTVVNPTWHIIPGSLQEHILNDDITISREPYEAKTGDSWLLSRAVYIPYVFPCRAASTLLGKHYLVLVGGGIFTVVVAL